MRWVRATREARLAWCVALCLDAVFFWGVAGFACAVLELDVPAAGGVEVCATTERATINHATTTAMRPQ